MHKKYCDICGEEVRSTSPGNENPRGNLSKTKAAAVPLTERHIFMQTSFEITPLTDKEYIGMICSDCYGKMIKYLESLQDDTK